MASRGKPPEGGQVQVSYTHDKVQDGQPRNGWLAGPIHGVWTHRLGTSKPCTRVLCGANAKCVCADKPIRLEWTGYVPVRRHDGRPYVVCIVQESFPIVDRLTPGDRIIWSRKAGKGESVQIVPGLPGTAWRHYWPNDPPAADLTTWLLRIWKMPDLLAPLTAWFTTGGADPAGVPAEGSARESMLGQGTDWVDGVGRAALKQELGLTDEEAKRQLNQRNAAFAKKAKSNGKH